MVTTGVRQPAVPPPPSLLLLAELPRAIGELASLSIAAPAAGHG